jgi:hypothetical protein
VIILLTI